MFGCCMCNWFHKGCFVVVCGCFEAVRSGNFVFSPDWVKTATGSSRSSGAPLVHTIVWENTAVSGWRQELDRGDWV